jgi:hypothetical protein
MGDIFPFPGLDFREAFYIDILFEISQSPAQYTGEKSSFLLYQLFPIIPWTDGVVPVNILACPGPV